MKVLLLILLAGISIYLVLCAFLYVNQRNLLYFPRPEVSSSLAEEVWIETEGARLKLWKMAGSSDEALLYFGGNAEPIELNIDIFPEWFPDKTIYLVNYRGFGGSTGKPDETGLCNDANEVFDQLLQQHSKISVLGRSLGSGIAMCLASQRPVDKVALVTPFDSILAVAQKLYALFPVKWLLKDTFDSVNRAPDVQAQALLIIASEDKVVPPENGLALAKGFREGLATVVTVEGADHINISEAANYEILLKDFFNAADVGE